MSLRARIALALAAASLVIVTALAATVYALARASTLEQLSARLGHLASGLADRLDTGGYERLEDMRILAVELPRAAREAPANIRAMLERRQASHSEFSWIGFTDTKGTVVAGTAGLLEGADVSGRPWWGAAREKEFVGDVHEALLLQKLLQPQGGDPLRFFDIALPVKEGANTIGIAGAHIGWAWARSIATKVLQAGGSAPGVELLIVSREGKVLLGPGGLEGVPLVGELASPSRGEGPGQHLWPDGREWVSVMRATRGERTFSGLGWRVIARQPRELALAPLDRLRDVLLTGALAAVAIASLLGYLIASRLANPLERWAHAADRIGAGDRQVQFPEITGSSELRRLSAALRSMSAQLNAKEDALQAAVDDRTAALVEAMSALEAERERLAYALEGSRLATWDMDIEANEVTLSAEWARMLGEPEAAETIATPVELLERVPPEEHPMIQRAMVAVLRGEVTHYDVDHRVRRADGSWLWIRSRGRVTRRSPQGEALRMNGTNADISARKQTEQELARQAFTDPLTLLPNRRVLEDRLGVAVERARRASSSFALLYLDLDGFKAVNDNMGHEAGDELLRNVGARLSSCVRSADTVARVGGDEFALLLDPIGAQADAEAVGAKVVAALSTPYGLREGEARVTASVGLAIFPDHGADPEALMRAADAAMYRAKSGGKNQLAAADAA